MPCAGCSLLRAKGFLLKIKNIAIKKLNFLFSAVNFAIFGIYKLRSGLGTRTGCSLTENAGFEPGAYGTLEEVGDLKLGYALP
jgi:hypothetical protein